MKEEWQEVPLPPGEQRSPIRDRSVPPGKASDVKPIRDGTKQAQVLRLMDAGTHVEEIAKAVGVPMSEVRHHISNLAKKGVGHTIEDGMVKSAYPAGRGLDDFFIEKAE